MLISDDAIRKDAMYEELIIETPNHISMPKEKDKDIKLK